LGAFGIRRLGMLVCVLGVLLGLSRVLLTLAMIILAVRVGSGAVGLCRGLVMFRRLVVRVFHFESHIGRRITATDKSDLDSGRIERQSCFNREA